MRSRVVVDEGEGTRSARGYHVGARLVRRLVREHEEKERAERREKRHAHIPIVVR